MNGLQKFDLTGRTALVTGGGRGLGLNITKALASQGARVLIVGRNLETLEKAVKQIEAEIPGSNILCRTVDLGDRASRRQLVEFANSKEVGGVDIYVGNAALSLMAPLNVMTDKMIDDQLQTNLVSNIELTRDLLPHMRAQKWGRVIFCSSVMGVSSSPNEGSSIYGVTKGALNTFARAAAVEAGGDNVTVNSLVLGVFASDMSHENVESMGDMADRMVKSLLAMTPLGRFGSPHELEGVIQLLASDAGSYITGTNLVVDGGVSISTMPNVLDPVS